MPIVLVERSLPEGSQVHPEDLARARPCYDARRIEYLGSYLSPDGSRMTCVYRAPDAASVREANDLNRQPYVRVWTARWIDPDGSVSEDGPSHP